MKRTTIFCLISAVIGGFAATIYHQTGDRRQANAQEAALRPPPLRQLNSPVAILPSSLGSGLDEFAPEERTNILVYEKANRSVVHITTKAAQRELLFLEVPSEGAGSGSVLDKSGHILTNYHVVEEAQEIRVTLQSGESYEGTMVGHDPPNDM